MLFVRNLFTLLSGNKFHKINSLIPDQRAIYIVYKHRNTPLSIVKTYSEWQALHLYCLGIYIEN